MESSQSPKNNLDRNSFIGFNNGLLTPKRLGQDLRLTPKPEISFVGKSRKLRELIQMQEKIMNSQKKSQEECKVSIAIKDPIFHTQDFRTADYQQKNNNSSVMDSPSRKISRNKKNFSTDEYDIQESHKLTCKFKNPINL